VNFQELGNQQIDAKPDKTQHSAAQQDDVEIHTQEKLWKKKADQQALPRLRHKLGPATEEVRLSGKFLPQLVVCRATVVAVLDSPEPVR
jgi:hypothetical protein